jgi:hypothetical protein
LLGFCVGHSVKRMIKATLTGRGTQVRFARKRGGRWLAEGGVGR